MSPAAAVALPLAVATLFSGGFMVNEWSHGGLAEAMGLGHRHMLDYGGFHCVPHDDADHGPHHIAHMHGSVPVVHRDCPGGAAMHGTGTMTGGMDGGTMHG